MAENASDLKSKSLAELREIAKKKEGYDATKHKTAAALRNFLSGKEDKKKKVAVEVETPKNLQDLKSLKTLDKMKVAAKKLNIKIPPKSKKSDIQKLLREKFVAPSEEGGAAVPPSPPAVAVQQPSNLSIQQLMVKSVAKIKEYAEKTMGHKIPTKYKKKAEIIDYLREKLGGGEGGQAVVVVSRPKEKEAATMQEEMEIWPVPENILRSKYNSVAKMKALLEKMGIKEGLPRKKEELEDLFKRSRCSPTNFSCSETEFCDLRNQICRELGLVRDDKGKNKKFAVGMDLVLFDNGRFYGPKALISKIRSEWEADIAKLKPLAKEKTPSPPKKTTSTVAPQKTPSPVYPTGGVQETKQTMPSPQVEEEEYQSSTVLQEDARRSVSSIQTEVETQQEQEGGIVPININTLLEKPTNEVEIRKAILNCLGLYNEINPNDELL